MYIKEEMYNFYLKVKFVLFKTSEMLFLRYQSLGKESN